MSRGAMILLYADDNTVLASTEISAEDDAFHLPFVPEGNYILKVSDAREVQRTVLAAPDDLPPTHTETKVLRSYGDASQPLLVSTDVQGILVSVPAAKAASTPPVTP